MLARTINLCLKLFFRFIVFVSPEKCVDSLPLTAPTIFKYTIKYVPSEQFEINDQLSFQIMKGNHLQKYIKVFTKKLIPMRKIPSTLGTMFQIKTTFYFLQISEFKLVILIYSPAIKLVNVLF